MRSKTSLASIDSDEKKSPFKAVKTRSRYTKIDKLPALKSPKQFMIDKDDFMKLPKFLKPLNPSSLSPVCRSSESG